MFVSRLLDFYRLVDLYRLRRQQWLETEEIEEIQRRKLVAVIKHAYQNVPYYRKLFASAGIRPEDIKSVKDLSKIPITTKSQIQELRHDEIIAEGVDLEKCTNIRTSGSTGIPLDIFLSKRERELFDMGCTRSFMENGLRFKDKLVYVWSIHNYSPKKCWFQHLGIMRREYICFHNENGDPLEALQKASPDIICGAPSILKLLSLEAKRRGGINIQPKAIFSTSEFLEKETRELIDSAFKAKVFDSYGAEEFGCIAWECGHSQGYHLNIDSVVVEFIRNGERIEPGERGELICTGLHSYTMPFIRYKIGDIGIPSDKKCPCGRGLPLMEKLEGRTEDFVKLPGGKVFAPTVFFVIMRDIRGIKQYRIVQEKIDKLLVYIVPGENFTLEVTYRVQQEIRKTLKNNVPIEIKMVDELPRDPSGKLRSVISKVPINF